MKPILNIFIFIFKHLTLDGHRQTTKSTISTYCLCFKRLSTLSTLSFVDTDREGGVNLKADMLRDRAPKFEFMGAVQEGGRGEIRGAVFTGHRRSGEFLRRLKQMSRYERRKAESAES